MGAGHWRKRQSGISVYQVEPILTLCSWVTWPKEVALEDMKELVTGAVPGSHRWIELLG